MKLGNNMQGKIDGSIKITNYTELAVISTALSMYSIHYKSKLAHDLSNQFRNIIKELTNEQ